jgi:hypothetical protein
MAAGLEEVLSELSRSQKFYRAHLNGIQAGEWDWKPFPACRSIREILNHWVDSFAAEDTALRSALDPAVPDVAVIQRLMREAGRRYSAGFQQRYEGAAMDDLCLEGRNRVGAVLASLGAEDNYHAGQIAFIRLAIDPEWDWVKAVHQTPEG